MTGGSRSPTIPELIERHHPLLYRYAYRLCGSAADAEDLTQQTYLIAHEKLHQLRDASSAKSWLCTILRHVYLRSCRARSTVLSLDCVQDHPARDCESNCDEEALQRALCALTEDYRSAVILYYFQELSYQEIAEVLHVPLGTVMSRLSRGKTQLKEFLEACAARESRRAATAGDPPVKSSGPRLVPAIPS